MEKRKTIGIFLEGDDVLQEGLIANALIGEAQVKAVSYTHLTLPTTSRV